MRIDVICKILFLLIIVCRLSSPTSCWTLTLDVHLQYFQMIFSKDSFHSTVHKPSLNGQSPKLQQNGATSPFSPGNSSSDSDQLYSTLIGEKQKPKNKTSCAELCTNTAKAPHPELSKTSRKAIAHHAAHNTITSQFVQQLLAGTSSSSNLLRLGFARSGIQRVNLPQQIVNLDLVHLLHVHQVQLQLLDLFDGFAVQLQQCVVPGLERAKIFLQLDGLLELFPDLWGVEEVVGLRLMCLVLGDGSIGRKLHGQNRLMSRLLNSRNN